MSIELGDEVKCKVTGFQGIVTSIAKCLTGCDRATVQPPMNGKDQKFPDAMWFDIPALEIVEKGVVKPESVQHESVDKKGGPPSRGLPK